MRRSCFLGVPGVLRDYIQHLLRSQQPVSVSTSTGNDNVRLRNRAVIVAQGRVGALSPFLIEGRVVPLQDCALASFDAFIAKLRDALRAYT